VVAVSSKKKHARPNVAGQSEFFRAQLTTLFIETVKNG